MNTFADAETLVQQWLLTTTLAGLTLRPDGGSSIFKAMPPGAPLPSIVLSRVGGGPAERVDMPQDVARMSFDCWGASRADAINLATALAWHLETLAPNGGYTDGTARLAVAETIAIVWLADKASDTPRYVVDALVTVIPA